MKNKHDLNFTKQAVSIIESISFHQILISKTSRRDVLRCEKVGRPSQDISEDPRRSQKIENDLIKFWLIKNFYSS